MRHAPLLKTLLYTWLSFTAAMAYLLFSGHQAWVSGSFWFWLLAGMLYVNFFEYSWHNFVMHHKVPGLSAVWVSHRQHHGIFNGGNFRSTNERDYPFIVPNWPLFPVIFLIHFAVALYTMPGAGLLPFFLGTAVHYSMYETFHWCTHVRYTILGRTLTGIPLLRRAWAFQVEWHRRHHETPVDWFNFTPPYGGDMLTRLWRKIKI